MGGFLGFCYRQLTFKPKPLPQAISLDGKTALITGANSGLGLEVARELATHNISRLILTVREIEKGEAVKASILEKSPKGNLEIEIWSLDHDSYDSIVAFQQRISTLNRLDYALLNAGLKKMEYSTAQIGHETNVQVNHIATSAISFAVLRALRKQQLSTSTRLTIVSSEGHFWVPFKEREAENILERMDDKATFGSQMQRYYTTKLLNVLWTRQLASKVSSEEVIINTVNPGFCYSGLHRYSPGMINIFLWALGWTSVQGGHCLVDALVQHDDSHGDYLSEQKITTPSPFVMSDEGKTIEQRIWEETVTLLRKEAPSIDMSPLV